MSMHRKPLTPLEYNGLTKHGLPIGTASQLSDCFRLGMRWALQAKEENHLIQCHCKSYNNFNDKGDEPDEEVVLTVPEKFRHHTGGRETVCVDACIAHVVQGLWDAGIPTLNSCCGHGKEKPSIVMTDHMDPDVVLHALSKLDPRAWTVSRWERVEYTTKGLVTAGRM